MRYFKVYITIFLMIFSGEPAATAQNSTGSKLIRFTTSDGGNIEAAFFRGNTPQAIIFTHGAVFNKESWYSLAEKFQEAGVTGLAIDFRGYGESTEGTSSQKYYDVLGAVEFLKEKGFKEINLIGGSMGAAAILEALNHQTSPEIRKVILLSPAGGPPVKSQPIAKLFIVSRDEGLYNRVRNIYRQSSEPKILKEFPGSFHAQHMFKSDYADSLTALILEFIQN